MDLRLSWGGWNPRLLIFPYHFTSPAKTYVASFSQEGAQPGAKTWRQISMS
jgi:hypothetical protein